MSHRWAAPTALADALGVLATDPAARPVAGGTDLVVGSRQGRRPLPDSIVAIDRIPELAGQRADPDGSLVLGALTSHTWLASADGVLADAEIYARPWGFRLEDVDVPVRLWHGKQDRAFSVRIAEELVKAGIPPECIVLALKSPDIRPHTGFATA